MQGFKRILIMAGGTGGHIFPGLAVAQYLKTKGMDVHCLGTDAGLEARLVTEANIPLHVISVEGVRGKGWLTFLAAPMKVSKAIWQAKKIIQTVKPDIVLGMGGFVSGPGGLASWLTGCPLIIHEQNAIAGLTNKILSRFAKKVLQGFPDAFPPQPKVVTVGNPVRLEIEALSSPDHRFKSHEVPLRLLVMGGSLGAQALNEIVPRAIAKCSSNARPIIRHQTGQKHYDVTKKIYESMNIPVDLKPFIKEMAESYAWADIVICRAGALTIAELCAAGVGAILVPYPFAVDDHQSANAHYMAKEEAAILIPQSQLNAEALTLLIEDLTNSPQKCLKMAQAAYQLRSAHVTDRIFDILTKVI